MSPVFARALAGRREELNARFVEARHRRPGLTPEAFGRALAELADPVVAAVAAHAPERADGAALAAYDVVLELTAQRLAEGGGRGAAVRDCWRRVLPAAAGVVAADPAWLMAALTNAACQVAATPGARAGEWADLLVALGPRCASPDALLRLGQVAAWRAGLAHYRRGALAAADGLPEPLALAASEWYDPAGTARPTPAAPATAGVAGAFRGFGGLFVEPPRALVTGEGLCLTSGGEAWLLLADRYGATFHRAAAERAAPGRADVRVSPGGRVEAPGGTAQLAPAGRVTSAAATATTLAVTWTHSYQVTLVALA